MTKKGHTLSKKQKAEKKKMDKDAATAAATATAAAAADEVNWTVAEAIVAGVNSQNNATDRRETTPLREKSMKKDPEGQLLLLLLSLHLRCHEAKHGERLRLPQPILMRLLRRMFS
ncbi:hypothetical protein SARC_06847 [Sphaeroforma arctica JP610]|uniref:Uncharacterized protein n=1 Tax=Sphaeroforma arctica JP610 TaxID=667725 RepID=A0A0L0FXV5_9EUKA|nr:hypothetical protein SARC_06847 [Sphaeroforma arctica JP610]KNC80798.1 hypothetical protein SARC_06847 [Sphaeroforma arctica JP610]|eukprot:XP_014154700.1 hypothetical protein SARC_06847 [Sphaeroforma arctica JP610]